MKINNIITESAKKPGLWANIHAKKKRIKAGSGERMRKPGSKGAPSDADLKASRTEAVDADQKRLGPDKNDPWEQGWRANPATAYNPYERGTHEYEQWEDGQAERRAQPNHYDESKDGQEKTSSEWIDLTDDEIEYIWGISPGDYEDKFAFPRAIEAAVKAKNARSIMENNWSHDPWKDKYFGPTAGALKKIFKVTVQDDQSNLRAFNVKAETEQQAKEIIEKHVPEATVKKIKFVQNLMVGRP
jgi:hypothetical protein